MVLKEILAHKRKANQKLRKSFPRFLEQYRSKSKTRRNRLLDALSAKKGTHLICELKRMSPSQGILRKHFEPLRLAKQFEAAGASAISILTEERYFRGSPKILRAVRRRSKLPILRKDFIIDPVQIFESVFLGADGVLLIVSILRPGALKKLYRLARWCGLDVLVEVHSLAELRAALDVGARIIGVNTRNLKTLKLNPALAMRIIPKIPKNKTVVLESGIETRGDILKFQQLGVHNFLVGGAIMRSPDVCAKIRNLLGRTR